MNVFIVTAWVVLMLSIDMGITFCGISAKPAIELYLVSFFWIVFVVFVYWLIVRNLNHSEKE